MKRLLPAALVVIAPVVAEGQESVWRDLARWPTSVGRAPVHVAILGTYHMSNPGQDLGNIRADDVKTPQRQREIEELVERLAAFNPTKIAIEEPWSRRAEANDRYRAYRIADDPELLSHGEDEQIGFRLAARLGHDSIYPIDVHLDMMGNAMGELLQSDPAYGAEFGRFTQMLPRLMDTLSTVLHESTVTDFLLLMNEPWGAEANHAAYVEFLRFGRGDNTGGPVTVARWYERNMRIFHYLTRVADIGNPNERILVIFGQGHLKLLADWVEQAQYFERVDIRPYLRGSSGRPGGAHPDTRGDEVSATAQAAATASAAVRPRPARPAPENRAGRAAAPAPAPVSAETLRGLLEQRIERALGIGLEYVSGSENGNRVVVSWTVSSAADAQPLVTLLQDEFDAQVDMTGGAGTNILTVHSITLAGRAARGTVRMSAAQLVFTLTYR